MIDEALTKYRLSPQDCVVIGDREKDMLAAHRAEVKSILVLTGDGKKARNQLNSIYLHYVAEDCNDAVSWLLSHK
ncbi:HAD hydrolase-like protein [Thalassobacillus hwangdonensis]|uniref:HAD hydrolase-like protein n=1 Tax=Thalassobacillus hwangdonensis TaxID=546108 RepID=A0ABW3KZ08_9BACI